MKPSEKDYRALDEYFGNRVYGWFRDGRDSNGRIPSKSKLMRAVRTWEELELWINVLDGREHL